MIQTKTSHQTFPMPYKWAASKTQPQAIGWRLGRPLLAFVLGFVLLVAAFSVVNFASAS